MGGIASSLGTIAGGIGGFMLGGPAGAALGAGLGGSLGGSYDQAQAAQDAANTQAGMAQQGIGEQQRQFDAIVKMMSPYLQAGEGAIGQQQNLLGLKGAEGQQAAIEQLRQSPMYQSMMQQGTNAMLQNASATGGLRGGNTQAAMAQFAPNVLSNLYQTQLANLGGLSQLGQASAGLQASAGQTSAANIGNLLNQQGAALAGGQIAQGGIGSNIANTLLGGVGTYLGAGGNLTGGIYSGGGIGEYFPSNTHVTSRAAW